MSLKDQVVVITGASTGIGAALARRVAARGGRPVLAARRERELTAVARECAGLAVVTDVTKRGDVKALLDAAVQQHGRVDVWVNNAGRGISRTVLELTDDDVDEMMRINVKSALYGMQVAAAHMKPRRAGQIVNVSSLLGRVPELPVRSAYSAAKHALNSLTADLRVELKDSGVTVTLVSPGITFTEFGLNALHGGMDSRSLPGGQTADEVAAVIADAIETKALDVYTRPQFKDRVVSYFSAMAGL